MRSILRITLILTVAFSTSQVIAQNSNKTLLQTEQMAAKLGLSDQQKADLDKELKANQAQRKATMEKMRALREEMKRDAFVQRQEQMERMKSILTPEQWEEYQKLQKAGKNKRQDMRRQRRGNPQGQAGLRGQNGRRGGANGGMDRRQMMLRKRALERKALEEKEGNGGN